MGVLTLGKIWVKPSVAVVAGDPVWFHGTTGAWGKATGTGFVGPIPGAARAWFSSVSGTGALGNSSRNRRGTNWKASPIDCAAGYAQGGRQSDIGSHTAP